MFIVLGHCLGEFMLLLLSSVCICRFRALMLSVVAVPKSDLEILPTKSKSPRLILLDEPMKVRGGGSKVDGINRWNWLTVELTLSMHCIRGRCRDLMMWPAVLHRGMLRYNLLSWTSGAWVACVDFFAVYHSLQDHYRILHSLRDSGLDWIAL